VEVVAAAPVELTESPASVDLTARRATLLRRRRAGRLREWLSVVAVGGVALWIAAMAFFTLVAR